MKRFRCKTGAMVGTAAAAIALASQPALASGGDADQVADQSEAVEAEQQSPDVTFDPFGGRIRIFDGNVDSMGGRIRIFEGDIDAMGGRIRIFEDDIDPFKGNIRIFWGDLTPEQGELDPKAGRIRIFTEDFYVQANALLASWESGNPADFEAGITHLISSGKAQWEDEILSQTGQSFEEGFADDFFAKWNLDPNDLTSIREWDAWTRQAFLIAWHDNLLNFSGMDQVDHWMNAVNWTPAVTQIQGAGDNTTIGVLDFFAPADADVNSKTVYSGGYQNIDNDHGAAVSSLLVSSHDGRGVMGIAPGATIAGYNPFDETFTASWEDVQSGIVAVGEAGASVVNLSLGVSGYTLPSEWRDLFDDKAVEKYRDNTVYVIAAGNDGITQTQDVDFEGALDTTFIVVGSVDPFGEISGFSNRPGEACLLDKKGDCGKVDKNWYKKSDYLKEAGPLMYRFLVAPGEQILVSDGQDGVTRASGTSFAAPLVSGAVALIQERWPWLKNHPNDVAKAILESAQDLGEPGVDPVYGWGMLNIEAAQSALDFNDLKYYLADENGQAKKSEKSKDLLKDGFQSSWSADDMYFVAFEDLLKSDRDFLIPLSTRLFNTAVNGQTMQEFMYHRFVQWMGDNGAGSGFTTGFSDMNQTPAVPFGDGWSFSMSGRLNTVVGDRQLLQPQLESTVQINAPDGAFGFAFGQGDSSALLGGQRNLGLRSDYNPVTGGANPLLGFAAGGSHVSARATLVDGLNFSLAVTNRDGGIEERIAREDFGLEQREFLEDRGDYRSTATTMRLDYDLSSASRISLAFTMLDEQDALFGVRSVEESDFGNGARSTGVTLAADFNLGEGVSVFGSATGSRSTGSDYANLRVQGALSSAFQLGVAKQGVLGSGDSLRMTVAQPLKLERGEIEAELVAVVDRTTGEKGVITERFDIADGQQRRFVAEGYYAAPVMKAQGEVSLFGRAELRPSANFSQETSDYLGGVKFRLAF
ncbi:S8 family serine peptidase [Erythrobacter sp. SCSIO 43205]|uniref:S8 family peptidase n=1 Tax=Erythrobacter sp. SCSIO 43205 TaxID=2779361 RepID=UPI001CA8771F|nr:S8 family peptidase [Erythrobacter sp. SCSIO 43205]UAB77168.1 S8 family serine peptidase [Erythrobacter sp. SCSIO 43205]